MKQPIFATIALSLTLAAAPCQAGGGLPTPADAGQVGQQQALGLVLLDLGLSFGPTGNQITGLGSATATSWSLSVNDNYLGNPFSLSVNGTYNSNTNTITFTGNGLYDGIGISTLGNGTFSLDSMGNVSLSYSDSAVVGSAQLSFPDGSVINLSNLPNANTGQYVTPVLDIPIPIVQWSDISSSTSEVPPIPPIPPIPPPFGNYTLSVSKGGDGPIVANITPEPSSIVLALLGVLGVAGIGRRRRQTSGKCPGPRHR